MGMNRRRQHSGQMTLELAIGFPVLLVVALIAVNAGLFFSECASFDRVVREAVRVYATSPAYGVGPDQALSEARQEVEAAFDRPYLQVELERQTVGFDYERYTARLYFSPTLFGMGLRSEVFGVSLPQLMHSTSYTVDTYKPGLFV